MKARTGLVVAGAAVLAAHAGPALTSLMPLRRHLLPAMAGVGEAGRIALTFDDGPDPASTPWFLEALDQQGWRATFFMLGTMVRAHPGIAQDVAAAGHEIALHGDQHRSHLFRSPRDVSEDLRRAFDSIADTTGREPVLFRPPYGLLTAGSLLAARQLRLPTVLWTAWGRDWRAGATPATVVEDVARGLSPGGTVLLHDSDCTSAPAAWRSTLGALPGLAELFNQHGLRAGPLGEHGIPSGAANIPTPHVASN